MRYHTLCVPMPPPQPDAGSPASVVAVVVSTLSVKGNDPITVAAVHASFAGWADAALARIATRTRPSAVCMVASCQRRV
jgi:hypothetical protein